MLTGAARRYWLLAVVVKSKVACPFFFVFFLRIAFYLSYRFQKRCDIQGIAIHTSVSFNMCSFAYGFRYFSLAISTSLPKEVDKKSLRAFFVS